MLEYVRLTKTIYDKGNLIPINDDVFKYIKQDKDYYKSLYVYNEKHFEQFKKTGTVAGIEDVVTNKILFDFDSRENVEKARLDTNSIVQRLLERGVAPDSIQIFYSGFKGFGVEIATEQWLKPEEFTNIVYGLALDLETFDDSINNASRIIRLPLTKHPETGLYKIPLTIEELKDLNVDQIKELAKDASQYDKSTLMKSWKTISLPESIMLMKDTGVEVKKVIPVTESIDLSMRPSWMTKCKYALSLGYFKEGIRNHALTALGATYKAQGLPQNVVEAMLNEVSALQAERNNQTPVTEREVGSIIRSVYSNFWEGGTYTCKTPGWLQNYCKEHGHNCEKHEDEFPVIESTQGLDKFKTYAENIDQNTVKFGIPELDAKLRMQVGHLVGLLASPGVGKTSWALTVLNNTSQEGIESLFFSYDMHSSILFQKLIQRETGWDADTIFNIYKNNEVEKMAEIDVMLQKNYSNVGFCFKSGQTIQQMKNTIKYREEKIGKPIKLIVVDYLELILSSFSEPTQASAESIQGLREIANEMDKAVIVLLQPNKMSSKVDEPLLSYNGVKGSSSISQACTAILTAHRPGFSSQTPEKDKFFGINCVKNRMGAMFALDFSWDGPTGRIKSLAPIEKMDLKRLRDEKEAEAAGEKDEWI